MDNTILIDSTIVEWIEQDWKYLNETVVDRRKIRQKPMDYDNAVLFWYYCTVAQPENHYKETQKDVGEWVKISQIALKPLGKSPTDFADLKVEMEARGWVELDNDKWGIHLMAPRYSGELTPYTFMTSKGMEKFEKLFGKRTQEDPACEILRKNMEESIDIDLDGALGYMDAMREKELERKLEEDMTEGDIVEVIPSDRKELAQYNKSIKGGAYTKEKYIEWIFNKEKYTFNRNKNLVNAIHYSGGSIGRDEKGRRLHSPFTTLRRELRKYISIDGEECAEIDISHFHPSLIANEMGKDGVSDGGLLDDCLQNNFYRNVSRVLEEDVPLLKGYYLPPYYDTVRVSARDRAKDAVMTWLNGSRVLGRERNPVRTAVNKVMVQQYPSVAQWVDDKKAQLVEEARQKLPPESKAEPQAGREFSHYLQRLESKLFVDELFLAVSGRYRIASFTIHDAIYVARSKRKRVRGILSKILRDAGIKAADKDGEL